MAEPLLDQSHKYMILGQDEKIWVFAYEAISYTDSNEKYWQAYSKKPGFFFVPQGPRTEKEVYEFIELHSHKLDNDDKLDLYLFIYKGGLEQFLERYRKKNESNTTTGRGDSSD